jgi:hypothetical protein
MCWYGNAVQDAPWDHKLFILFILHEELIWFEGASLTCCVVDLKLSQGYWALVNKGARGVQNVTIIANSQYYYNCLLL